MTDLTGKLLKYLYSCALPTLSPHDCVRIVAGPQEGHDGVVFDPLPHMAEVPGFIYLYIPKLRTVVMVLRANVERAPA